MNVNATNSWPTEKFLFGMISANDSDREQYFVFVSPKL